MKTKLTELSDIEKNVVRNLRDKFGADVADMCDGALWNAYDTHIRGGGDDSDFVEWLFSEV